jgi:outer membrane lipoprotein-sorting protein
MRSTRLFFLLLFSFFLNQNFSAGQDLTAVQIVQKSIDLINGRTNFGETEMTIVRPKYERNVSMKTWSLGENYFMIYITSPARDKGQVFLKRGKDMWNWMPTVSRMIKIPSSMMAQNWMGSDFTNDDLVKMNSLEKDYQQKIMGEEEVEGYSCHKIELIPNPESAVVWGKVVIWIAREHYYQMKTEFYDEDIEIVNRMESFDITQFGDRKLPAKMVMTPVNKKGQKTILLTKKMEFNVDIEEDFFSQQNMKKVR